MTLLNKIFLTQSKKYVFEKIILEKTGHKLELFNDVIEQNFLEMLYQIFSSKNWSIFVTFKRNLSHKSSNAKILMLKLFHNKIIANF